MITYLYRAISMEHVDDGPTGEPLYWPGSTIGRSSGYLSRSAAVEAGKQAKVQFKIVRSEPVVFLPDPELEALAEADELRYENRRLREQLAKAHRPLLRAVSA